MTEKRMSVSEILWMLGSLSNPEAAGRIASLICFYFMEE
jgi:hypothetical protein